MKRILGLSLVSLVAGVLSVVSPSAATATQRAAPPEPAAAATSQPKTDRASVFESEQRLLRARHVPLAGESDVARTAAARAASASAPGLASPRGVRPAPPVGPGGGSISGTVTAASGGAVLGGICVYASPFNPGTPGGSGGSTAADGTYTVSGLAAGSYRVQFSSNCGNPGNYATQWYAGQSNPANADAVSVADGVTTPSIDAALQLGGSISGTVTSTNGGAALSGICVTVSTRDGFGISGVGTGADGTYTLNGLGAGQYTIGFNSSGFCPGGTAGNYIGQWWNGRTDWSDADPVSVVAGETTSSINAVMQPGASISGTVTAAAGGATLEGICATAALPDSGQGMSNTATAANGTYTITGLPPGEYIVQFDSSGFCQGGTSGNYAQQWWDHVAFMDDATRLTLSTGQSLGSIDAAMQLGGSISGTVTDAEQAPLAGICALAALPDGRGVRNTATDGAGNYTITGLSAGEYIVQFDSSGSCPNGTPSNYIVQWYDGKTSQESATRISVSAGQTTPSINAVMEAGGSISGTVTAAGGGGVLEGICVNANPVGPNTFWGNGTGTGPDGKYTITGLPAGDYTVQFSVGCGNTGNYAAQWYDNQPNPSSATPVTVTAGLESGSINAEMQPGGTISGTVTAAGNDPLEGICALATFPDGQGVANTATDADGHYTITGLSTGDYKVQFDSSGYCPGGAPGDYATQWYNHRRTQDDADTVAVTAGEITGGINAAMDLAGSISGTVTASSVGPLSGICATATLPDGQGVANAATDADGQYTITGLSAGDYLVQFDSSGFCPNGAPSNYISEWWDNQPTQDSANPVSVTAGADHGSIDAVLVAGGSISGTVTAAEGGGELAGICVGANPAGPSEFQGAGTGTQEDGTYTITGLPAGDYQVQFSVGCGNPGNYAAQWYNNKSTQAAADPVTVAVGADTGSINAALQAGASISGTVSAAGGGPLEGICAMATLPDGYGVSNAGTAADGTYTIIGLPAGDYLVQFDSSGYCPGGVPSNYIGQWWNNKPTQDSANPVSVSAGQPVGSINAVMQPGGSISGTVTAAEGGAGLGGICVNANPIDAVDFWGAGTGTQPNGTYTITGLPAGDYQVQFSSDCGNPGNYATQWYDNATVPSGADPVTVTVGHDTDSINAAVQPGGSISGTVTAAAGGALGGVCVAAILPPDEFITGGSTDADGTYTIRGLAVGDYIVGFSTGCGYPGDLVDQWFDHQSTPETANLVTVTAGHTTGSIDAAMYPPGAPGVPTAVTATAGSGKVLVAWTAPVVTGDGITGYDVRYRPVGAGSWTTSSTTGTPTHAIISSLANGTQYELQVRAVSTSAGSWSSSVTATPAALGVTITGASGGKNTLTVSFTVTGGTWFDSTGAAVAHTQTCAVGSAPGVACTSPATLDLVPGGLQSVTVATTDADGTHASATTTGVKVTGSKNPKPPRH